MKTTQRSQDKTKKIAENKHAKGPKFLSDYKCKSFTAKTFQSRNIVSFLDMLVRIFLTAKRRISQSYVKSDNSKNFEKSMGQTTKGTFRTHQVVYC